MRKTQFVLILFIIMFLSIIIGEASAISRFPKPEFESGHVQPETIIPNPRMPFLEYVDVFVLIASLSFISWLILKKRSRKGVFWMSVFSIVYFGFYREGCICSVGSLQNVSLALFKEDYFIPLTALLFFVIPVIYTLLFGRTFCAGICPLGAMQDIVGFKPIPIPIKHWLERILGIIPFIYLALAVLYAATGTEFVICRYDPFVGFYRLDGTFSMVIIGILFLLIGVFIARPYCRFLCPYGALLSIVSRFSFKHMTISPKTCINCKLCENSCPYGAINIPTNLKEREKTNVIVRRYVLFSLLIPLLIIVGGYIASNFHESFALVNNKVKLANEILNETNFGLEGKEALEITGFKSLGVSVEQMYAEAVSIINEFYWGSWLFGGFVGLVFGLTLLNLSVFKYHPDYTPDKANCHSCARCMDYCPVKLEKK